MALWEASPLGDGLALGPESPRGLASHKGRGGLGMVLREAGPLGDGLGMQPISEGRQQTRRRSGCGSGAEALERGKTGAKWTL